MHSLHLAWPFIKTKSKALYPRMNLCYFFVWLKLVDIRDFKEETKIVMKVNKKLTYFFVQMS